jgi:hypothetical protein
VGPRGGAGFSLAAASLWFRVGAAPRGPDRAGVWARVGPRDAAGPSPGAAPLWLHVGSVSEKGLDRSGGSGLGWVCGTRLGLLLVLRRCGCEWAWSPKGPRPERWVSTRLGLRGAATILHLRGIHARCFLRVDRATRRKNRGEEKGPVRAVILPSRGPSHAKGESLPTRRAVAPAGRRILPSRAEARTMLRSRRDPTTNAASFDPSRTNAESCVTRATLREPDRPRTPPPVEALSERRSTRSHSDATARLDPPGATQQRPKARLERRSRRSGPSRTDTSARRAPAAPTQPHVEPQPRRRSRRPTVAGRRR